MLVTGYVERMAYHSGKIVLDYINEENESMKKNESAWREEKTTVQRRLTYGTFSRWRISST